MAIFGFGKKPGGFRITQDHREWVDESFAWLISVYGYPGLRSEQLEFNERYFPETFGSPSPGVDPIIADLCRHLGLNPDTITFEVVEDIRDTYAVPYLLEGKPFEAGFGVLGDGYRIQVAAYMLRHPQRLVYSLVQELLKIRFTAHGLSYGEDDNLFIFIAGIYFGCGVLLAQSMDYKGKVNDGSWETRWIYGSGMPEEMMAFALATYAMLVEQHPPAWKEALPVEMKRQFGLAAAYLGEDPGELYDKAEVESDKCFGRADALYLAHRYEEAVAELQKVLFLTKNVYRQADAYNDMGYYSLRMGAVEAALTCLKKSIELRPGFGNANDNLGYALLMNGRPDEAKEWLDKALHTEGNNMAYTFMNLALYHQAKNEITEAEAHFAKAFEAAAEPVVMLEYYYADFLSGQGKEEEALKYLQMAAEKGEPEAVSRWNEINKDGNVVKQR